MDKTKNQKEVTCPDLSLQLVDGPDQTPIESTPQVFPLTRKICLERRWAGQTDFLYRGQFYLRDLRENLVLWLYPEKQTVIIGISFA